MGSSKKFYAVAIGRECNVIHDTWDSCQRNVKGIPNAHYKGFTERIEAETWLYERSTTVPRLRPQLQENRRRTVEPMNNNYIYMYTDGSYAPTVGVTGEKLQGKEGKRGGWAFVFVYQGRIFHESHGHVPYPPLETTNNSAELYALGQGLLVLLRLSQSGQLHHHVRVRSDSDYGIKALNGRIEKWKRDNWKTSSGSPVKNRVLIEALSILRDQLGSRISFEHVYGHETDVFNNRSDELANEGRKFGQASTADYGFRGWAEALVR